MNRRRRWVFIALSMLLSMCGAAAMLLAADLYVHHRAEKSAGLNRWGYRGPVLGRKRPGETRIAVLGGSTVFGYGVLSDQSLPAVLERELRQRLPGRPISVVNLGFNNEGAFALEPTLRDFQYLDLDIAVFYAGYNDRLGDDGPNTAVYRHESPIFRLFGYFPILPLALKEKAVALRTGGQLARFDNAAAVGGPKPVFTPNVAQSTSAGAMEAATRISDAMSAQINRLAPRPVAVTDGPHAGCAAPWVFYCDAMLRATAYARGQGIKVLMVLPPLMTRDSRARHQDQQRASTEMLQRHFGSDAGVSFANLSGVVDLTDRHYSFDEMHLDQDGNALVAKVLAEPVLAMTGPS